MVYKELLVQEGGMSIPSDAFKRLKAPRQDPRPAYCGFCGAVFSNRDGLSQHRCLFRRFRSMGDDSDVPDLPAASTSILCVCRLIHLEALPILYTDNTFYFSSPATARAFLWNADRTQAVLIQAIIITLANTKPSDLWWKYTTESKGLAEEFPHLRRMIINLRFELASAAEIRLVFQSIAESVRDLDWVHINRFNNEELLDYLKPMVSRYDNSHVPQRQVQSHITRYNSDESFLRFFKIFPWVDTESTGFVGWKNATLWWGASES